MCMKIKVKYKNLNVVDKRMFKYLNGGSGNQLHKADLFTEAGSSHKRHNQEVWYLLSIL